MIKSLWGDAFDIDEKAKTKKVLNKIKKKKKEVVLDEKALSKKSVPIEDKLRIINENVDRILGRYKENTLVIKTREQLSQYITKSIENKVIAIDTETNNSLDPLTCKLMGACVFTPGEKNAYIPINHKSLDGEKLEWQLTEDDIFEEFSRLNNSGVDIITHNGKFDYKVLYCTTGWEMPVSYDTMIAARLLDENDRAGLKYLYIKYIDPSIEHYSIDHLFENIEYGIVDPNVFALYAATDSYMTYKLFELQKKQFESEGFEKLYSLYRDVEIPVMNVAAKMELRGIALDTEYSKKLSEKYHRQLEDLQKEIAKELDSYAETIATWRLTPEANHRVQKKVAADDCGPGYYYEVLKTLPSKSEQLKDPVEVTSPLQLSILLYDVLKIPVVNKKSPRSTDKDVLEKLKDTYRICDLVLQMRELTKMLTTFIDVLPQKTSEKDGRVHASFNQLGTDTGRFSCSEPNLQQIPSHQKDIRMMFKASEGKVLVGSDFSQQEPRLLSAYSQDENLINAYKQGKDLYATIASIAYHNDYWDNMEHDQNGQSNPDGKARRSKMKTLVLGIMYGMGSMSMASKMGCTTEEAQSIIDRFYGGFPKVRQWIDMTTKDACKNGYVEDFWGRRRRLTDLMLDDYSLDCDEMDRVNPLVGSSGRNIKLERQYKSYVTKLNQCFKKKEKETILSEALKNGVKIKDNTGFIAQAKRQCVNARIQGGAATMSKKAMILVDSDEELKNLGFSLLIGIHDELIGECPKENAEQVAERLTYLMRTCVPDINVPFKCDPTVEEHWYEEDYSALIQKEYDGLVKDGYTEHDAFDALVKNHIESSEEKLKSYLRV